MYLDESGDHSLKVIDPSYPIFVLGGIIVDRDYARDVIAPRLRTFKQTYFDREIVLHTADIARARNGYEMLKDPQIRAAFMADLNMLMRDLEYEVVACAIRKDLHLERHGPDADDPYLLSLHVLVEHFCGALGDGANSGFICAEKRGEVLDRELERAWVSLLRAGTGDVSGHDIDAKIVDLGLKDKGLDIAGLELADLVVSPIGRVLIGKPPREDWHIVERKLRRRDGEYRGFGLIELPNTMRG